MSHPPFTAREFRDALSCFATGVTIITASNSQDEAVGMTASSFNSVSMDPPLILWSVTKTAHSAPIFKEAKHFAVHILGSEQSHLSNTFAKQGVDKFLDVDVRTNQKNVPLIEGVLACLECNTWNVYEGGDHWIIVGEVEQIHHNQGEGLVFSAGSYATASPLTQETHADQAASSDANNDPLQGLLIYQLAHAYRKLAGEFHQYVFQEGIAVAEWRILASLHNRGEVSLNDLCQRAFIEPETLPSLLKTMAEKGLCHFDGTTARGTDKGHELSKSLYERSQSIEQKALMGEGANSSSKEMDALITKLQTLSSNLS